MPMLYKRGHSKNVNVIFMTFAGYFPLFGTLSCADDQDWPKQSPLYGFTVEILWKEQKF